MRHTAQAASLECGVYEGYVPERILLAAVLERAFRDLFHADKLIRLEAVAWFRGIKSPRGDILYFSFKQVSEVLELSSGQLDFLFKKVAISEVLHEEVKKREQENWPVIEEQGEDARKRMGKFFKRTWGEVCQTYQPIQRQRRAGRCYCVA